MPETDLKPTVSEMQRALYFLDEAAVKRFVRHTLAEKWDPEMVLLPSGQLHLLLLDWLAQWSFISDAQRETVVLQIDKQLGRYGVDLMSACGTWPVFTVVIADYQWISCLGREMWYDLNESEDVETLPQEAVTFITCDVTAMYMRMRLRVQRIRHATKGPADDRQDSQCDPGPSEDS